MGHVNLSVPALIADRVNEENSMLRVTQRYLAADNSKVRELVGEELDRVAGGSDAMLMGDPNSNCSRPGTRTGCGPDMDRTSDYDC